ncbi:hypothetical protein TSAR_006388 [Trichomalopsis sarcophagae]|uniref:Reverse transcriptase domain-containing protein n=1 Tax=Trichomalopsis sarcophagae TaxID=543379 RepID=A0A232EF82_9HYME|nr:hypothetical protein TSAR_006388 [Trichomalopsis sarcophagae]
MIALYANNKECRTFTDELNLLFHKLNLDAPNDYYIIADDFNARHTACGDSVNKTKGSLLKKWSDNEGISYRSKIISTDIPASLELRLSSISASQTTDLKYPILTTSKSAHSTSTATTERFLSLSPFIFRFMFKKTKWSKFQKNLTITYNNEIPPNINLSNDEINNHLLTIQNAITNAIESTVPRYKPQDNMLNYVNRKIAKLHKDKSYLISTLNRLYKINTHTPAIINHIINIERLISETNELLKSETQNDIPSLTTSGDKIIVDNPKDILNTVGAYYETINSPRYTNIGTANKNIVDNELIQIFEKNISTNNTITTFNDKNSALNPKQPENTIRFTTLYETKLIFSNLPNKSLSGLDNIPPIIATDNQFGFRQNLATTYALYKVLNDVNTHLHEGRTVVAFADDFTVLVANTSPVIVQEKLETLVNKINNHYNLWNLRINPSKCETILFHKPLRFLNSNKRKEINQFKITIHSNGEHAIPHKKTVLGVHIDSLLRLNTHVINQLTKAKNAFRANNNIFFNKNLSARTKIICYLLLIRPIITYAAPIWWNASASTMERIRKFERLCLRACLHIYRRSDTNKFISNKLIYDKANIPRIDSFFIKLNHDYFAKLKKKQKQLPN